MLKIIVNNGVLASFNVGAELIKRGSDTPASTWSSLTLLVYQRCNYCLSSVAIGCECVCGVSYLEDMCVNSAGWALPKTSIVRSSGEFSQQWPVIKGLTPT